MSAQFIDSDLIERAQEHARNKGKVFNAIQEAWWAGNLPEGSKQALLLFCGVPLVSIEEVDRGRFRRRVDHKAFHSVRKIERRPDDRESGKCEVALPKLIASRCSSLDPAVNLSLLVWSRSLPEQSQEAFKVLRKQAIAAIEDPIAVKELEVQALELLRGISSQPDDVAKEQIKELRSSISSLKARAAADALNQRVLAAKVDMAVAQAKVVQKPKQSESQLLINAMLKRSVEDPEGYPYEQFLDDRDALLSKV